MVIESCGVSSTQQTRKVSATQTFTYIVAFYRE